MSSIEWTDDTWNPIIGCSRHSAACDHCYAITIANRFQNSHQHYAGTVKDGDWTSVVNVAPSHIFEKPRRTQKPTVWFVNSMSDLFHENSQDHVILAVFEIMNDTPRHQYQVLTKRPQRALKKARELGLTFTPNIWLGASVGEDKFSVPTVRALTVLKREFGVSVIFVSAEPLLEGLPSLDVAALDWLIAGGESGVKKSVRPMSPSWARDLRDRCRTANIPFFFKQWGKHDAAGVARSKVENGHLLDGEEIFEMPVTVYDAIPRPDPSWSRGSQWRGYAAAGLAAPTPAARFEVSGGKYVVEGDLTDDALEAVAAKLREEDVHRNPNYRASEEELAEIEAALGQVPLEFWEVMIRTRPRDLDERQLRQVLRQLVAQGRVIELKNPLRFALPTNFLWLVGEVA